MQKYASNTLYGVMNSVLYIYIMLTILVFQDGMFRIFKRYAVWIYSQIASKDQILYADYELFISFCKFINCHIDVRVLNLEYLHSHLFLFLLHRGLEWKSHAASKTF